MAGCECILGVDSVTTERTNLHRSVEALLDEMGISYQSEVPIDGYCLDIYLPEWHLAIEVDGMGHYPKKDQKRDTYLLLEHNIQTLRITKPDREKIVAFIERCAV